MEAMHGEWQHMSAREAAEIEAEAGIKPSASYDSVVPEPGTPGYTAARARMADARELIATGEAIDEPTVELPPGSKISKVLRLRGRTPQEVDDLRPKLDDIRRFDDHGYPRRAGN